MNNLTSKLKAYFKKSPVTASLVFINAVMVIIVLLVGGFDPETLTKLGGLIPSRVIENNEYYRLILAMFLHGSIIHFLFNTYFLHFFGSFVENLLGKVKYIIIYFVSGLGSGLLILWLGEANTITIGASGALFGILGALLVLTYLKSDWFHPLTIKNIRTISVVNLVFTLLIPNISVYGHLGGFITGSILIYFLTPNKKALKQTFQKRTNSNPDIIDHEDISEDDIFYH